MKLSLLLGCSAKGFAADAQFAEVKAQTSIGLETDGKLTSLPMLPSNFDPVLVYEPVTGELVLKPIALTTYWVSVLLIVTPLVASVAEKAVTLKVPVAVS